MNNIQVEQYLAFNPRQVAALENTSPGWPALPLDRDKPFIYRVWLPSAAPPAGIGEVWTTADPKILADPGSPGHMTGLYPASTLGITEPTYNNDGIAHYVTDNRPVRVEGSKVTYWGDHVTGPDHLPAASMPLEFARHAIRVQTIRIARLGTFADSEAIGTGVLSLRDSVTSHGVNAARAAWAKELPEVPWRDDMLVFVLTFKRVA